MPTLTINGKPRDIQSPADTPLLWILRDELSLTGTKFGCGMGLCGACTVLADGEPIRSCLTTVDAVKSKKIVTIEGLSPNGTHPLQKAWSSENVPQCGYCQAGQIMSAAALLMKKPKPTDADIDEAMDGNLCRCATYQRIRKAIHVAASGVIPSEQSESRDPQRNSDGESRQPKRSEGESRDPLRTSEGGPSARVRSLGMTRP